MGCRISTDWKYKGMRTLILENRRLRVVSLLDKGSDIIELVYKPLDVDFMWHSPLNVRSPSTLLERCRRSQGSFIDHYQGGWQDVLPNAGPSCTWRGVEWGQHSITPALPWNCSIEESSGKEVVAHMRVDCRCYPFSIDKWMILREGESFFTIKERITNRSEQDLEFSWLQHLTFGRPFLAPSNRIYLKAGIAVTHDEEIPGSSLPAGEKFRWPVVEDKEGREVDLSRVPQRDFKAHDLVYIIDLKEGGFRLMNEDMGLGFGLVWDRKVFPYLWFWRPLGGAFDHPWFGRAWAIGLEPCTSWPSTGLKDQVRRGTAARLKGEATIETEMKAIAFEELGKSETAEELFHVSN